MKDDHGIQQLGRQRVFFKKACTSRFEHALPGKTHQVIPAPEGMSPGAPGRSLWITGENDVAVKIFADEYEIV